MIVRRVDRHHEPDRNRRRVPILPPCAVRRPQPDGTYRIHGQKIFITYGEHDMTSNIVHLVGPDTGCAGRGEGHLAVRRAKFLVKPDGTPERNDVHCVSIEHKLGIHASPTAVMAYGDKTGAVGYLSGEENRGLEYMFIMMNAAATPPSASKASVFPERAYQRPLCGEDPHPGHRSWRQGRRQGGHHSPPDVRRMLMLMKSQTEAMRAVAGAWSLRPWIRRARCHPDAEARSAARLSSI